MPLFRATVTSIEDNFSYILIEVDDSKTVPEKQQMTVYQTIFLDGVLNLNGSMVISDG